MKLALVHQGGGAKGAFGAGVIKRLDEAGLTFPLGIGVSVGALNTTGYAVGGADLLTRIWVGDPEHNVPGITEKDAYEHYSLPRVGWRLISGATSLYKFDPLYKLILKELGPGPYPGTKVGWVSYKSGKYFCTEATARTTYASASMPIFAEAVDGDRYDGGVRHVTPLADAIDCGADGIVVVLCNPRNVVENENPPRNIIEVILRTMDIVFNQIASNDITLTIEKNDLVKLAEMSGVRPVSPSGKVYRHIPIMVIEPPEHLGGTLDFNRALLDRRYALGYQTADAVLAKGASGIFTETEPQLRLVA